MINSINSIKHVSAIIKNIYFKNNGNYVFYLLIV